MIFKWMRYGCILAMYFFLLCFQNLSFVCKLMVSCLQKKQHFQLVIPATQVSLHLKGIFFWADSNKIHTFRVLQAPFLSFGSSFLLLLFFHVIWLIAQSLYRISPVNRIVWHFTAISHPVDVCWLWIYKTQITSLFMNSNETHFTRFTTYFFLSTIKYIQYAKCTQSHYIVIISTDGRNWIFDTVGIMRKFVEKFAIYGENPNLPCIFKIESRKPTSVPILRIDLLMNPIPFDRMNRLSTIHIY